MCERTDVVEAEHAGPALDGVRVAEQRADGIGVWVPGLDREQHRIHLIEPLRRLSVEDAGELGIELAHGRAPSSESNTRGTSMTPIRSPSLSTAPTSMSDSVSSAASGRSPTQLTSSIAKPAWHSFVSATSRRP